MIVGGREVGGPEDVEMLTRGLRTDEDAERLKVILAVKFVAGMGCGLLFGVGISAVVAIAAYVVGS